MRNRDRLCRPVTNLNSLENHFTMREPVSREPRLTTIGRTVRLNLNRSFRLPPCTSFLLQFPAQCVPFPVQLFPSVPVAVPPHRSHILLTTRSLALQGPPLDHLQLAFKKPRAVGRRGMSGTCVRRAIPAAVGRARTARGAVRLQRTTFWGCAAGCRLQRSTSLGVVVPVARARRRRCGRPI